MAPKSEADLALEFAQSALSASPTLILGSGASAAHGVPGMGLLAEHLRETALPADWDDTEREEWGRLINSLKDGRDLESALQSIRPSDRQTQFVAIKTRAFLLPSDESILTGLLGNKRLLPLSRLYRHQFTSTHRTIDVVTPNYDRLAEYAADAAEFAWFTGFNHGYLQTRAKHADTRIWVRGQVARTVCIWKVHGSLDWFQDAQHQIIGIQNCGETPDGLMPLMITPGLEKYKQTHDEPFRTILSCCDRALENARAYFCIGYGFNDEHVQAKLIERCDVDSVPLIIITRSLTPTAKAFLSGGRCRRFLALEESSAGARAYMHAVPGGLEIPGPPIWRLDAFLDWAIGAAA